MVKNLGLSNIVNRGNIQLRGFRIKSIETASGTIKLEETLEITILTGNSQSIKLNTITDEDQGKELLIVPVVLAETTQGEIQYACADKYGVEATI